MQRRLKICVSVCESVMAVRQSSKTQPVNHECRFTGCDILSLIMGRKMDRTMIIFHILSFESEKRLRLI